MILKSRKDCLLCHSENIILFKEGTIAADLLSAEDFKITDSRYGASWTFYSCQRCGFVFANPQPAEKDIVCLYAQLEDQEYSQEREGRAKNFTPILKRLEKFDPPNRFLLDIGAASGIFLNLARQRGYDVSGIEPSAALCDEAQRLFGLKLFHGTIEQYPRDQKFGVISLIDILEHVSDPDSFLGQVEALQAEQGILVAVTPDISSIAARLFPKRWWHLRTAHINFFNLRSLSFLLAKHHFSIVGKKRYAWHFSLFYLLSRIFPGLKSRPALQKVSKRLNLKLQLFDSWEIYARKGKN